MEKEVNVLSISDSSCLLNLFDVSALGGALVRLEPLSKHHLKGLAQVLADGALWENPHTVIPMPHQLDTWWQSCEQLHRSGEGQVFVIVDCYSGRVTGSTRLQRYSAEHQRIAIGYTFLGASWQRKGLNTESKYLLLKLAFEALAVKRVEFIVDTLNKVSRCSLEGLGAIQEGAMRHHMVMPNGRQRDTAVYSILAVEWMEVKRRMQRKMCTCRSSAQLEIA